MNFQNEIQSHQLNTKQLQQKSLLMQQYFQVQLKSGIVSNYNMNFRKNVAMKKIQSQSSIRMIQESHLQNKQKQPNQLDIQNQQFQTINYQDQQNLELKYQSFIKKNPCQTDILKIDQNIAINQKYNIDYFNKPANNISSDNEKNSQKINRYLPDQNYIQKNFIQESIQSHFVNKINTSNQFKQQEQFLKDQQKRQLDLFNGFKISEDERQNEMIENYWDKNIRNLMQNTKAGLGKIAVISTLILGLNNQPAFADTTLNNQPQQVKILQTDVSNTQSQVLQQDQPKSETKTDQVVLVNDIQQPDKATDKFIDSLNNKNDWNSLFQDSKQQQKTYEHFSRWEFNPSSNSQDKNSKAFTYARIQAIYDLQCPDSRDAHQALKSALFETIPGRQKQFSDYIHVEILPFAVPYKAFSFEISEVVPYIKDQFTQQGEPYDVVKQAKVLDMYQDLVWSKMDEIKTEGKTLSKVKFVEKWSKEVEEYLKDEIKINVKDLQQVLENTSYDNNKIYRDSIQSWKYASQPGIDQFPTVYINGRKLIEIPKDKETWMTIMGKLVQQMDQIKLSQSQNVPVF